MASTTRFARHATTLCSAALIVISTDVNAQGTPEIPPPPAPVAKPAPEKAPAPTGDRAQPPPPAVPDLPPPPPSTEPPAQPAATVTSAAAAPPPRRGKMTSKRRIAASPSGETGVLRVASAYGMKPRTLRLSFGLDFFSASSVFTEGDDLSRVGGVLGISGSPVDYVELWLNTRAQTTESSLTVPRLLQAQGDVALGVKGFYPALPFLSVGADAQLTFLSGIGDSSFDLDSTQFQLRALLSTDLRETEAKAPVELHLNLGIIVDGSDQLSETALSDAERFGLGVSDFNRFSAGFAVAIPVKYITPYLEYSLQVPFSYLATPGVVLRSPVSSQSALRTAQTAGVNNPVDIARPAVGRALPQTLTPGVRVTALEAWTFDLAVEIGLTPSVATGIVATPPYNVMMFASYALDPLARSGPSGPPVTVPVLVPEVKEVEAASKTGVVIGRVSDKGDGRAIAGAVITFDRAPPVATADQGRYQSHEIEPGPLAITVAKDGYRPGAGQATIAAGATIEVDVTLETAEKRGKVSGMARDDAGNALADVEIRLTGSNDSAQARTSGDGRYELEVKAGSYRLKAQRSGHYTTGAAIEVADRKTETAMLTLGKRPETAAVAINKGRLDLQGKIEFADGDDQLSAAAKRSLAPVVDLLLTSGEIKRLRVEAHVDNSGDESANQQLTKARAGNVKAYLESRGVAADRLVADGVGSSRPRAPNLTSRGRAQNRRIELHIVE